MSRGYDHRVSAPIPWSNVVLVMGLLVAIVLAVIIGVTIEEALHVALILINVLMIGRVEQTRSTIKNGAL
jgi:hypothetical protein